MGEALALTNEVLEAALVASAPLWQAFAKVNAEVARADEDHWEAYGFSAS